VKKRDLLVQFAQLRSADVKTVVELYIGSYDRCSKGSLIPMT
jgi:hypothetical protein